MQDTQQPSGNGNGETKWRKYLFNEVTFAGMIIAMTISVTNYFNAPAAKNSTDIYEIRTNIALIQQSINNINVNHEVHIQDLSQATKELQAQQVEIAKQLAAQQQQLIILLQQLNK